MRSIRLSLVVYFLLLLALGLGAVSVFAYQTSYETLRAKEATRRHLLQTQYEDRRQEAQAKLDRELLTLAQTMAKLAGYQYLWNRVDYRAIYAWGLVTASTGVHNHQFQVAWIADVMSWARKAEAIRFWLSRLTEIQLAEDNVPHPDNLGTEFIQINSALGTEWRSRSLGSHRFPFDAERFAAISLYDPSFEDTELEPGLPLRRVTLKAPVAQTVSVWPPGPPQGGRPPPGGRPRGSNSSRDSGMPGPARPGPTRENPTPVSRQTPPIFIQCAFDRRSLDASLAELETDLVNSLTALEDESAATLASLRHRLSWIGLATFAATVLGGFWLVWVGLSPLNRLSEAVSQVSERDFRLPLEQEHVPRELRPIVERLTQTLDQLKRAFAREKQAAADISHELRTPLAALLTTIEVALRKPRPPEEYRELLADCLTTGQQMSQLVERLLALTRLDAGVDRVRPREVDVAALADQCAALVRPLAEARELTLSVARHGPTCLVADADKLREVLTNLLHNAIEYNRPHGSVEVAVERSNGHVQLEVRDTGIGITPQAREHIFERFYRADPSRAADGLHAGLGLAIVKGYVDLMGGTITVDSTEGQGSTFRVLLPAS